MSQEKNVHFIGQTMAKLKSPDFLSWDRESLVDDLGNCLTYLEGKPGEHTFT